MASLYILNGQSLHFSKTFSVIKDSLTHCEASALRSSPPSDGAGPEPEPAAGFRTEAAV